MKMKKLSFDVPLGIIGLKNMADKALEVRDSYNRKSHSDEWVAWHMVFYACMDLRAKELRSKRS